MTDTASTAHPHEPDIPPALDDEGRCLVCSLIVQRDEAIDQRDLYRNALIDIDTMNPNDYTKSFFESFSGGEERDFEKAFKFVVRTVNRALHNTDENGNPL